MGESSVDLKQTLQQLASATDVMERIEAARALGRLESSSEEIIEALIAAKSIAPHAGLRNVAGQALEAPVHRAFLEGHPGLAERAQRLAEQASQEGTSRESATMREEFVRRRRIARIIALMPSVIALVYCGGVLLLLDYWKSSYPLGTMLMFVAMGGVIWWSWKTWRCPACEQYLGSFKAQLNPFFATRDVFCPHCGRRLL